MADAQGYLPLARRMFDGHDPIWESDEPFDRRSAWIDLCQMALYQPRVRVVQGELVSLGRGQLLASERFLSGRWHWPRAKVRRYLEQLSKTSRKFGLARIELNTAHEAAHVGAIITLLNYDVYNELHEADRPTHRPMSLPDRNQVETKLEEGKELTTQEAKASGAAPRDETPTAGEADTPPPPPAEQPDEAAAELKRRRNEAAEIIRDVLWLSTTWKPSPELGVGWTMQAELGIWGQLVKRYTPREVNGALRICREVLGFPEGEPLTLRLFNTKGRGDRLAECVGAYHKLRIRQEASAARQVGMSSLGELLQRASGHVIHN